MSRHDSRLICPSIPAVQACLVETEKRSPVHVACRHSGSVEAGPADQWIRSPAVEQRHDRLAEIARNKVQTLTADFE